jgi:hypothetical protein
MARRIVPPRVVMEMLVPQPLVACHGPHPSRIWGELVQGGDLPCKTETCRGEIPLVGNWSETLPTGQKHDVLLVWVLTGVSVLLVLNLGLDIFKLCLHVVDGVGLPCVKGDLFDVKRGP